MFSTERRWLIARLVACIALPIEGYYWNLSRYIHLNPCNGSKPLAATAEAYQYSSYPGYARKSRQVDWIAYEDHHRYWAGLVKRAKRSEASNPTVKRRIERIQRRLDLKPESRV